MADQHEPPRYRTAVPSHDDVARRAYQLFEAGGGEPGHDVEHWLDAERQLTQTLPGDGLDDDELQRLKGER